MRKLASLALGSALLWQFAQAPEAVAQTAFADVANLCRDQSLQPSPSKAKQIVSVVEDEWRRFGANLRYPSGQKYRVAEDAWIELRNPSDGKLENMFAWARVNLYWQATGNSGVLDFPYDVAKTPSGQFERDGEGSIVRRKVNLGKSLAMLEKASANAGGSAMQPEVLRAFRIAATRASLIEQPWSAVFVSTMMKIAELPDGEFKSAGSHSGYMREALAASKGLRPGYRYIACPPDPAVLVRTGDLICNARGATKPGFDTLWSSAGGFVSHCDIVTAVVQNGSKFKIEAIGGNVQDNVTKTTYVGTGSPSLGATTTGAWLAVLLLR